MNTHSAKLSGATSARSGGTPGSRSKLVRAGVPFREIPSATANDRLNWSQLVAASAWTVLAAVVSVAAVISPARVAPALQLQLFGGIGAMAAAGAALVALGAFWPGRTALALSRVWAAQLLLLLGSVYLTPYTGPLRDDVWSVLGPGVPASVAAALQGHGLWGAAVGIYNSGPVLLVLVLTALCRTGAGYATAVRLADALVVAGVVGLGVFLIAPTEGPTLHGMPLGCAAAAAPGWEALRAGVPVVLAGGIPGLIGSPSFHAVAGVLLALAGRSRWATAWGVGIVATAVPVGGHWPAEVAVGVVLGILAWRVTRPPDRRAELLGFLPDRTSVWWVDEVENVRALPARRES